MFSREFRSATLRDNIFNVRLRETLNCQSIQIEMQDRRITSAFYDNRRALVAFTKADEFARCVYRPGTFNTPARDRDLRDLSFFSFPSQQDRED